MNSIRGYMKIKTSPDTLNIALSYHQKGRLKEAIHLYLKALASQPENPKILYLLGVAYFQQKDSSNALNYLYNSLEIDPLSYASHNYIGMTLALLGQFDDALSHFEKAISINPQYILAYIGKAGIFKSLGQLDEALTIYDKAIHIDCNSLELHNNKGNVLKDIGRFTEALTSFNNALKINPNIAEIHNNKGSTYKLLKNPLSALNCYTKAIHLRPNYIDAYYNAGNAYHELNQLNNALTCYNKVIYLSPEHTKAFINKGEVLIKLNQFEEAKRCNDTAITLDPSCIEAHLNLGTALHKLGHHENAIKSYRQALKLNPKSVDAYFSLASMFEDINQLDEALENYEYALGLDQDYRHLQGRAQHIKMRLGVWENYIPNIKLLNDGINEYKEVSMPFDVQSFLDIPEAQKRCSEIYVRCEWPDNQPKETLHTKSYKNHKKIKVGYFSSDFGDHPVTHLLASLFQLHNRDQFEIIAFAISSRPLDEWKSRIIEGVDIFLEASDKSDKEIIQLARSLELDIAIDLNGFTKHSRPATFIQGLAPIQIGYLGYLGTMGTHAIDYLIADEVLIPQELQRHYTEKIIYLPCYQCNDNIINPTENKLKRSEYGLPDRSFVFCSFNQNYKITPEIFSSWVNILKKVPDSVLWIYASNRTAEQNLKGNAERLGIDPSRLIFAEKVNIKDHIERLSLADLFLDTYPYNAGATASNALRAGLPVLTLSGTTFSSRIGASLLKAVGLNELTTCSLGEYEALAIELSTNKSKLSTIKMKLHDNIISCQLFNTSRFVRNLEQAFLIAYERSCHKIGLDHIYIPS